MRRTGSSVLALVMSWSVLCAARAVGDAPPAIAVGEMATQAGDQLSADWFLKTQDYLQLGDAGRQQAAEKAEALWAQLESRKKNGA